MSRMWRSRRLCASASSVLGTAEARGGMTTSGGGSVHRLAIIGAVRRHGRDLALDRLEQCRHLTGVIGGVVGQEAGDDLAGIGADGEVQLAPGPARPAVLLRIPTRLGRTASDRCCRSP